MATTYRKADADDGADALVERLIRTQHQELKNCGVTIQVMLAQAAVNEQTGEPEGPAVLLHGYPCCAIVKVNSHKNRAEGKRDATITLDGDNWKDWPEPKRLAILDHELQHLQVTGKVDDCGRPKLKVRLHDWQYAVFVRGRLVYLGQSVNLHLRFRRSGLCRRTSGGRAYQTCFGVIEVGDLKIKIAMSKKYGDWAMRELRLLSRFAPEFNSIRCRGKESMRG